MLENVGKFRSARYHLASNICALTHLQRSSTWMTIDLAVSFLGDSNLGSTFISSESS